MRLAFHSGLAGLLVQPTPHLPPFWDASDWGWNPALYAHRANVQFSMYFGLPSLTSIPALYVSFHLPTRMFTPAAMLAV